MLIYKYAPTQLVHFELSQDMKDFFKMLIQTKSFVLLLVGDRKTSLINALLCEYYKQPNLDLETDIIQNKNIMYINFIKDQGVIFYRDCLKSFCQSHFTIQNGLRKTVVLDNLDCLSATNLTTVQHICFNLIETYSNVVNFVISTTTIKKIMESIQSHSLIITIPSLNPEQQKNILTNICNLENISITPDVLNYLLSIEKNNINGLINYLEKFKLMDERITLDIAKELCTNISFDILNNYIHLVLNKDLGKAMEIMEELTNLGYSVIDILDTFFLFIKTEHCVLNEERKYAIIPLICEYIVYFNTIQENNYDLFFFTNRMIQLFDSIV